MNNFEKIAKASSVFVRLHYAASVAVAKPIVAVAVALLAGGCAVVPPQVSTVLVNDRIVSDASVSVQMTRGGATNPVAPGTSLEPGDIITTQPGAEAVLLLENGAVEVILLGDSQVRISSIWFGYGEVFVRVVKKLRETFEVESEYGIAGVEGTVFAVRVPKAGATGDDYECITLEGDVRLRSPTGTWSPVRVNAGTVASIEPGMAPVQRKLDRREFNTLVERMNRVERVFRPGDMRLLAPDVVGLMEPDARSELGRQGLVPGTSIGKVTDAAPIGQVLTQSPTAGSPIEPGASVSLEVEAEPTTVPRLVGVMESAAERLIAAARLQKGEVVRQITGHSPKGEVLRQRPAAGDRVPVETAVDLWIEAESVRVPQLMNTKLATARRLLADSGLSAGNVTEKLQASGTTGLVVEQSIAADEPVAPGTRIDLVVSERGIAVPNLSNTTASSARSRLSTAGLRLGQTSSRRGTSTPGRVIDQDPSGGTLVRQGESVDIVIDSGCRVPSVVGMNRTAASTALSSAGLTPSIRNVGIYNKDNVSGQQPASGTLRCGTVVYLDLGTNIG